MTPNEYRKKHKRCATCEHWIPEFTNHFAEFEFENAKLKTLLKQIVRADFADFIERRSTENDTTGSNRPN